MKNFSEREAYKDFLKKSLYDNERTEEKKEDINRTNNSSLEEEKDESQKDKGDTKKKSFFLKLKDGDFWKNTFVKSIFVGVVIAVILGYFTLWSDLKAQDEKISNVRRDLDSIISKYDSSQKGFNDMNLDLNTFKVEIRKDLEFIKDKLK
ncbi:MAG: hypothetical protein PHS06_05325 [Candidatus Shapirobacteria bacterium]|nr:hypothetical protein [Candidatus Shapirobacteria bacterium]